MLSRKTTLRTEMDKKCGTMVSPAARDNHLRKSNLKAWRAMFSYLRFQVFSCNDLNFNENDASIRTCSFARTAFALFFHRVHHCCDIELPPSHRYTKLLRYCLKLFPYSNNSVLLGQRLHNSDTLRPLPETHFNLNSCHDSPEISILTSNDKSPRG